MVGIPASRLVNVAPQVVAAGGTGVTLNGLFLSQSVEIFYTAGPLVFASAAAVSAFFGPTSYEAAAAAVYFAGFDGSNIKPASMLFALYSSTAGYGSLMGGPFASTLAALQALNGVVAITVSGVTKNPTINLASATSYSSAATIFTAALTSAGVAAALVWDSVRGRFYLRTTTAGATLDAYADLVGIGTALGLTAATGGVYYPPTPAMTPTSCMAAIAAINSNWASFTTCFEPATSDAILFAQWSAQQGDRFCFIPIDTDPTPTASGDTTSLGYQLNLAGVDGTAGPVWGSTVLQAVMKGAFVAGIAASLDFTQRAGRATFAYRSGAGLIPDVTNDTIAQNLLASGYNFYATYATASQAFTFLTPGSMTGQFDWLDSYYNQIWLNSTFQANGLALMKNVKSIPYNAAGYAMISASNQDTVNSAIAFGAIRTGVTLSALQIAEVNAAAGFAIDQDLSTQGYAWVIADPGATVRVQRGSPSVAFFYMDGGSIQKLNISSIEVQ